MKGLWTAGAFGLIACTAVWAQDPAWMSSSRPYAAAGAQDLAQGNPQKAEQDFDADLRVNPFDPVALNNMAVVESERGNNARAEKLLERAVQLAPDNVAIAANLARVHDYMAAYTIEPGERPVVHAVPLSQANVPAPPPELWGRVSVSGGTPSASPAPAGVSRRRGAPAAGAPALTRGREPAAGPAPAATSGGQTYYNGCSGQGFTQSAADAYRCRQAQPLPLGH